MQIKHLNTMVSTCGAIELVLLGSTAFLVVIGLYAWAFLAGVGMIAFFLLGELLLISIKQKELENRLKTLILYDSYRENRE